MVGRGKLTIRRCWLEAFRTGRCSLDAEDWLCKLFDSLHFLASPKRFGFQFQALHQDSLNALI